MALTKIPAELSSTPGISDSSTSTAITIDSSGNVTFNGTVTATAVTQSAGDGSTKIATTAYADAAAAAVVDAAPSTLDTLNELAAALGDDPNFATTVTNSIAAKAPLASPSFTGTLSYSGDLVSSTSGTSNFRAGVNAGNSIASGGNYNVVVGDEAGTALTTGDRNVAIGYSALSTEDTATHNTAVGAFTLAAQNAGDIASYNTAVGHSAGYSVTTGVENSIVGGLAGDALTIGYQNVVNGFQALSAETTGSRNVAIGINALNASNSGGSTAVTSYNVAVGALAGAAVTTGTNNTIVGGLAGDAMTTGSNNTFIGYATAGAGIVTGSLNTAVGGASLANLTSGSSNVCMGWDAGDTTTSGSKNICIGQNANSDSATTDHTIVIGHDIAVSANHFGFGKASNIVYNVFTTNASWARSSDERLKKNVQNTDLGLNFINDLRTVKYNWKANHELDSSDTQLAHLYKEDPADNDMDTESTMHGFIAQEVKTALDTAGVSDWGGWLEDGHGVQQISREMFVIPLVKAVQELSAQVTALQAEVAALKGE
jgi:hypothetical protein